MKGKEVLESRATLNLPSGFQIRIWRDEEVDVDVDRLENKDVHIIFDKIKPYFTLKDMLEILKTIPRVVAIEITDSRGEGIVWYDWY